MSEYVILNAKDSNLLSSLVCNFIQAGYLPNGSLQAVNNDGVITFYQPMLLSKNIIDAMSNNDYTKLT